MSELQEITPIYLYGQVPPTVDDGALFHYTTFDSFIKILETMTLRSSSLSRMNDLNEACLAFVDWSNEFLFYKKAEQYIKEECSVISFTKNYMSHGLCKEGSNHPAMWAHYADNSNGVCIVLNQEVLINNNRELLANYFYKLEDVKYSVDCAPDNRITRRHYNSVSELISKEYRGLFFKKHRDWSYEKETRFFIESPRIYLNIKGAIKHIVLGRRVSSCDEKLKRIVEMMISPGTSCYQYLEFESFASILPSESGYIAVCTSPELYKIMQDMANHSSLVKSYLEWRQIQQVIDRCCATR